MRIDEITLYAGNMPVKTLYSYGKMLSFAFIILKIRSGDFTGYGEAMTPIPQNFYEYLQSLIGQDARCLDHLLPEKFNAPLVRISYESVSIALHDLVARQSGMPLAAMLGGISTAEVPLMPCIFPNSPEEAGEMAASWRSRGFRYLKTKLLGRFSEDVERIRAIRSAAPDLLILQADANAGYQEVDTAVKITRALNDAGLDIFEDPMHGTPENYAELRKRVSGCHVKIMIDEFARSTRLLVRALKNGAADVVNIHPDQPGSLTTAMTHAKICQGFGVPVYICGTGYTGIGSIAYQHLCASLLPGTPCGELGGFWDHGMPVNSCRHGHKIENGVLKLNFDIPGTGAEFDEEAVSPYIEIKKSWK